MYVRVDCSTEPKWTAADLLRYLSFLSSIKIQVWGGLLQLEADLVLDLCSREPEKFAFFVKLPHGLKHVVVPDEGSVNTEVSGDVNRSVVGEVGLHSTDRPGIAFVSFL